MVKASIESYRYERKFVSSRLGPEEVERIVRSHPVMFREVYPPRSVNNIYFDSDFSDHYVATVEGLKDRGKYRLRWYGQLLEASETNRQFEIKIRRNLVNRKKVFRLGGESLRSDPAEATEVLLASDVIPPEVKEQLKRIFPVLINRYRRKYFLSADQKIRLTIDHDIVYLDTSSQRSLLADQRRQRRHVVVELKYSPDSDTLARKVASWLPFRLARNSKYVNGIDALRLRGSWR